MSVEENKAVVRLFIEAGNNIKGDVSKVPALVAACLAPGHVHHVPAQNSETKLEETTAFYNMFFSAFPDVQYTIDDMVAEGDKVAMVATSTATHRGVYQGMPGTSRRFVTHAVDVFRVIDGKITDEWSYPDLLGLMQQLGAIPSGPPK